LEKNNTGNPDFAIQPYLRDLFAQRKYGQYAENGELHICYTGSNHTTGGNSGSPALNSKGELVGINFDRSWESTMSDIMYNPDICRNIMVDVRYVLWVIDEYAHAGYLLEEMKLNR
jgi:Peptidase S46